MIRGHSMEFPRLTANFFQNTVPINIYLSSFPTEVFGFFHGYHWEKSIFRTPRLDIPTCQVQYLQYIKALAWQTKCPNWNSHPPKLKEARLRATMILISCLILCFATTIILGQTVSLPLPGFQGRELEARILSQVCQQILWHWSLKLPINFLAAFQDDQTTTYHVTCPQTVAASDCGIYEAGMTAIAKKDSIELVDVNRRNRLDFSAHSNQVNTDQLPQHCVRAVSYHGNNVCILLCYKHDFCSSRTSPKRPQLDGNTCDDCYIRTGRRESSSISTHKVMATPPTKLPSGPKQLPYQRLRAKEYLSSRLHGLMRHNELVYGWLSRVQFGLFFTRLAVSIFSLATSLAVSRSLAW
jgi:hypothetical protein